MDNEQLDTIKNQKVDNYPPRAIIYASYFFVNRGYENERDGSHGYYSIIDIKSFFRLKVNKEKYFAFLDKHGLKKTAYEETL